VARFKLLNACFHEDNVEGIRCWACNSGFVVTYSSGTGGVLVGEGERD